jgi:hypothetical protein
VAAVGILSEGTFFIPSKGEPQTGATTAETDETPEENPDEEPPKQIAVKVTAHDLIVAYMQDEQTEADSKYKDKLVEVTGIIERTSKNEQVEEEEEEVTPYVLLGGNSEAEMFSVKCIFTAEDKASVEELQTLSSITIQGTCKGYDTDVILEGCTLKEADED